MDTRLIITIMTLHIMQTTYAQINSPLTRSPANQTYSGCTCLNPWLAQGGRLLQGSCSQGISDTQNQTYCVVNTSTCAYPPISTIGPQRLLGGLSTLEWDVCLPRTAADKTLAGCSCLPIWGYGGRTFTGGKCQNPDGDSRGPWCMIFPGSCTSAPAGPSTSFHEGWDYCAPNTTPSPTPSPSPVNPGAGPSTTLAGCQCSRVWYEGGKTINGTCGTPDNDPVGPWCRVDVRSCAHPPERSRSLLGAWDYCGPLSPLVRQPGTDGSNRTTNGCTCKATWVLFTGASEVQYGCRNPDDDPSGAWCVVDNSTCTPAGVLNATKQPFDYCSTGARATPSPTGGRITAAGCRCLPSWDFEEDSGTTTTFTGGVCGRPDDDPAGDWCEVDAKTCAWQPFGVDDTTYWDYCQPPDTPRTQAGCLCRNIWALGIPGVTTMNEYLGTVGSPDNDPRGPWCPVQPQTCQLGLPFGMLSRPATPGQPRRFFDYGASPGPIPGGPGPSVPTAILPPISPTTPPPGPVSSTLPPAPVATTPPPAPVSATLPPAPVATTPPPAPIATTPPPAPVSTTMPPAPIAATPPPAPASATLPPAPIAATPPPVPVGTTPPPASVLTTSPVPTGGTFPAGPTPTPFSGTPTTSMGSDTDIPV